MLFRRLVSRLPASGSSAATAAAAMLLIFSVSATAALNDNLVDAQLIDLNGRISQDVSAFSRESGEVQPAANTNTRTAWFVWTAPTDAPTTVRFSTYGSNYDTTINLFKPSPTQALLVSTLVPVAGTPENPSLTDDDGNINVTQGHLTWSPQPGATYYISVGRNGNGGGGNSTLEATFGAVTLGGNAVIPNDSAGAALEFVTTPTSLTQVPKNTLVPGSTIGATTESGENVIGGASAPKGGTVWYRYTTGATAENFSVELTGFAVPNTEIVLQAFRNQNAPGVTPTFPQLTYLEEDRASSTTGYPRVMIAGAANTEYYFRVTGNSTATSGDGVQFGIRLDFVSQVPANDTIAAAIALTPATLPVVRNQGENIYSATTSDPTGFTGNTDGANVWYSWKAPSTGLVRIRSIAPTLTANDGNFAPVGSTFRFDCEVYFDTAGTTDSVFDVNTRQTAASFRDNTNPQEKTFYALKDVTYFIEIGGDNDTNTAGRGYFGFVIEDARITEAARTGVSFGPEGVLKTIGAPVVNKTGDLGFSATFEPGGPITSAKDTGLFVFNGATTRVVTTEGSAEYDSEDEKALFGAFSNLFLADRTNDANPDLGFNATLTGSLDGKAVSSKNNKGFYHGDAVPTGILEFRLSDYVESSLTWGDGGGFLGSFNTPVRKTTDNTGLASGRMVGIPAVRDTAILSTAPNVVLQEEDPAPNTSNGVEFGDLTGTPSVNSLDALAFRATLRGTDVTASNDQAIYTIADFNSNTPTALNYRLRLRKGQVVPAAYGVSVAGGATLLSLGEPRISAKGRIVTLVGFKPGTGAPAATSANDTAILSDLTAADGSFSVVAREGDAPRDEQGALLPGVRFVSFLAPVLITNNAVIFTAKISGTGVTAANDTGIWLWDGSSTYLVARKGAPAPGVITAGATIKTLGVPLANNSGRIAFVATLAGAGVTTANDAVLYTVSADGLTPTLRLRKGDVYNFGRVELPVQRTITSITLTTGSGGDDGFARGMDQDGNVAVVVGLAKGKTAAGQAAFKVAP